MQTNDDRDPSLVELGSVTADTLGEGGPFTEAYIGMKIPDLSDE